MEAPNVRYARSGDVNVAYSVVGDGPFDVVFVSGWVLSNLEVGWEGSAADFYKGISSFSRLILFDKRGTGLSDRVSGVPDLETRMDDVRAVMDAAGSRRAAVMGFSEGGPLATLFAATYPERTAALVLYGSGATFKRAEDYPWSPTPEELTELLRREAPHRQRSMVGSTAQGPGTQHQRGPRRQALVAKVGARQRQPGGGDGTASDEQRDRRPPRTARHPGADPDPASG